MNKNIKGSIMCIDCIDSFFIKDDNGMIKEILYCEKHDRNVEKYYTCNNFTSNINACKLSCNKCNLNCVMCFYSYTKGNTLNCNKHEKEVEPLDNGCCDFICKGLGDEDDNL